MKLKVITGLLLTLFLIGMLTLALNIQPAKASGTVYIRADGSIDPPTAPVSTIDSITYTFTDNIYDEIVVERSNIIIDGNGYTLQGSGTGNGFYLSSIDNVTIKNATIKNYEYGIRPYGSSNNTIFGNNITANKEYGISFYESSYNSISENNITESKWAGIILDCSSNNRIFGNSVANNNDGICLSGSSNNVIYHNNFINNTNQVDVSYDSVTVWDDGYPSGGNYWSDHICTGNPSNGSQPYIIDANNIDHYPFQDPNGWLLPHGPWADFTYSPPSPATNEVVTFDASASLPGWNGTHQMPIISYAWNFGDGNITITPDQIVTHKYTVNNTYTVTLNVTDI